jgi:hypothetical protein
MITVGDEANDEAFSAKNDAWLDKSVAYEDVASIIRARMLRAFDSDWLIAKSRADWIVVFILIIFCA